MPIEFACPGCSKLLRTPDDSAGKKAKCPQCYSVVDVPFGLATGAGTSPGVSPFSPAVSLFSPGVPPFSPVVSPFSTSGEGSPFDEGQRIPPAKPTAGGEADTVNPYASPAAPSAAEITGAPFEEMRMGLPWETQQKSAKVFWNTSMLIISSPTEAFGMMWREGGLGTPIAFALIGGGVGGFFAGVYNTLLQLGLFAFLSTAGGPNPPADLAVQSWIQVAIQLPIALAGGTLGTLIGSFIAAGLYHLCLLMLGGARFPYETTFRVVAYVNGATALIQVFPFCGQYIVGLMALIYTIIGLANAHRIGGGKAAAAVLLPIVVCGVACGLLVFGIAGLAFVGLQQ